MPSNGTGTCFWHYALGLSLVIVATSFGGSPTSTNSPVQVLFVAGPDTHGWGQHDHNAGVDLLAKALQDAMAGNVAARIVRETWPSAEDLAWATTCVVYSDGWQRSLLKGPERLDAVEAFMNAGKGVLRIHWATGSDKQDQERHRELFGGNMENGFSVHSTDWRQSFKLAKHPISSGVKPFQLYDECYFHMHWHSGDKTGIADVLTAIPEPGFRTRASSAMANESIKRGDDQTIAWCFDRPAGGRAFSYTGGHYHFNWANDNLRKLMLNAILWTAGGQVPERGLASERPTASHFLEQLGKPKTGGKKNPGWTAEALEGYLDLINRPNTSFHWRPFDRKALPPLPKVKN